MPLQVVVILFMQRMQTSINYMKNLKTTIEYLIVSGLILANALLLYGVAWTLKDIYYIDITLVTLCMSWVALLCLLIAIISLAIELYRFVCKYIKRFKDS